MELSTREKGDIYVAPGRYQELVTRIRTRIHGQEIPTLFVYSFDHRTRLGPFLFVDKLLIPGAPLAVGAALHAAGFEDTRLVLQQWTPNLRTDLARLDGRLPEMLFVSSMQIHSAEAVKHIRNAWRLGEDRPLILAGGAKAIYEPWDFFALSPDGREGADVVVTGEEFVVLELFDRLLDYKRDNESMRTAFERCRRAGLLADIPGLVYRPDEGMARPDYLVDTGRQRMVQNLGELPMPIHALGMFEPPHRRSTLSRRPLSSRRVGKYGHILGILMSRGCKFHCPYCPIPAYNQFAFRTKTPEQVVEEMATIASQTGISKFFGTDDNFFNHRESVEEIFTAMARGKVGRKPFRDAIWFGTEGTEFDVYQHRDLLPLGRDAGLQAIWIGVEDMTGELVKKGQSVDKTGRLFRELAQLGIAPMPMMMHHDGQPFRSDKGSMYGLANQIHYLRKAGAISVQVTFLTPATGSQLYEGTYNDGMVIRRAGDERTEDRHYDGNYCVATHDPQPLQKQWNILKGYATFYNPLHLLQSIFQFDRLWSFRVIYQILGNLGVVWSYLQTKPWTKGLKNGPIEKFTEAPRPAFELRPVEILSLEKSQERKEEPMVLEMQKAESQQKSEALPARPHFAILDSNTDSNAVADATPVHLPILTGHPPQKTDSFTNAHL